MTGEKVIYTNECVACPKDKYINILNSRAQEPGDVARIKRFVLEKGLDYDGLGVTLLQVRGCVWQG